MGNPIKEIMKRCLYERRSRKYAAELERQKDRYAQFLLGRKEKLRLERRYERTGNAVIETGNGTIEITDGWIEETKEATVIYWRNGMPDQAAESLIREAMKKRPGLCLAYGQEDFVSEDGRRHSPWFKPVWSPDTLQTSFYMGSLIAVRRESWLAWKKEQTGKRSCSYAALGRELVRFCLEHAEKEQTEKETIGLIDAFLYHGFLEPEEADAFLPEKDNAEAAVKWEGGKGEEDREEDERLREVSVVIPSKDNLEVLSACLTSLRERTKKTPGIKIREILVIDNGSSEQNRRRAEQLQREMLEIPLFYRYEPMEFNFSAMCNLGASMASGEFLLFLNDDMEIIQPDWLEKMMSEAKKPWAGAVGAKLLYPGTDKIQHAGVTNLRVGPAHKLLKCEDHQIYYHGRNRGRQDMLAVTAACLLVERKKFEAVGGFFEGIAVSYNDVDLCFRLYEKGWYNIQCNDAVLYHHESLSRGDDNLSEEKWERLLKEKHTLYKRHPALWKQDPFYSPHLAEHFSDYICNFEYEYERRDCCTRIAPCRTAAAEGHIFPVPAKWRNDCLTVNVEHAKRERKLDLTEEEEVYWIEGWSYVLGMDNLCYDRCLYLLDEEKGKAYRADILTRYRKDVADILPEQTHVELAGFVCRIPKDKLPAGNYRIAMLARDRCSSQKLYKETDVILAACF